MFTVSQAATALGHAGWAHTCSNKTCEKFAALVDPYEDGHGVWCPGCGNSVISSAPDTDPIESVADDLLRFGDVRGGSRTRWQWDGTPAPTSVPVGFGVVLRHGHWYPVVSEAGRLQAIGGHMYLARETVRDRARAEADRRQAEYVNLGLTQPPVADLGECSIQQVVADLRASVARRAS